MERGESKEKEEGEEDEDEGRLHMTRRRGRDADGLEEEKQQRLPDKQGTARSPSSPSF